MRPLLFLLLCASLPCAGGESWMRYPAISPDGKTIVFSAAGDLFTVPSAGGRAVPLTRHVAYDYMPVWSPDGTWVAFASDRYGNDDVYLVPAAGGEEKRLTFQSAHDYPSSFTVDGERVLFSSTRRDAVDSLLMPHWSLSELYSVPVEGGRVRQLLTTPAEEASCDPSGKLLLYHDFKGYEDPWRKHQTSSVARDIWVYDREVGKHERLTDFAGEDRDPVWGGDDELFYLSERSGSFNVWRRGLDGEGATQLTNFENHPVRFLSRAGDGLLCFGYHGAIFTLVPGEAPREVEVELPLGAQQNEDGEISPGPVTELALSPDGKEVAFVARGEVFVTSLEHKATQRITNTTEQERSVSYHPEGRGLIYAAERGGSWNLFESTLADEEEGSFHLATALEERAVLKIDAEAFQPVFSPDGKHIAYLEERENLMVLDVETGERRKLLDRSRNYSYRDGDIQYCWSPDSRWVVTMFLPEERWIDDLALIPADGSGEVTNITLNGYADFYPQWTMGGDAIVWLTDREGRRSHAGWGSEDDVYALFLNDEAYRAFEKPEVEREAEDEREQKKGGDDKEEDGEKEEKDAGDEVEEIEIEWERLQDRVARLTRHSGLIYGARISPDKETLYYLSRSNGDFQLWKRPLLEDDRDLLATFPGSGGRQDPAQLEISVDGKTLVVLAGGSIHRIETKSGKKSRVEFSAVLEHDLHAERAHLFDHIWRQTAKKFHRSDMHGVDWEFYRDAYEPLLPHVHHTRDFCELVSEMLGELNASHTGAKYLPGRNPSPATASLGILHDWDHEGPGVRILGLVPQGPLARAERPPAVGTIIEKINGEEIGAGENHFPLLWRQIGKRVRLSFHDPASGDRWEEVVRPLHPREEYDLLYKRWVERMSAETERLSDGRIGYMHVRGMNDRAFREFFGEVFGRHAHRKALVVDTRFNGGGWLTEDLTAFLSGQQYLKFYPREKGGFGGQPIFRWSKPSAVLVSEGNYSDAHMFPFAYRAMGIGKIVGMPVPGTATAVWWERLIDPDILFGIPQVSMVSREGQYLENLQLEPDLRVENPKEDGPQTRDRQLEAAVEHLLALPDPEPWAEP